MAVNGTPKNGNGTGNGGRGELNGFSTNGRDQIREIVHVLFKRWRLAAILFIIVALPGLLLVHLRRPVYVATAKVLITTQRADMAVQPTDLTRLTTVSLNESVVNSEVHIIRSRELIEEVVNRLASGSDGFWPAHGNGGGKGDRKRRRLGRRMSQLSERLRVTPIKNSNIIQISYGSPRARDATLVVNRVIDEYLEYHAAVHGTKGLTRFYEDQRRTLRQNLQQAEHALREFALREGVVNPIAEIKSRVAATSQAESKLREVEATITGLEEKIRIVAQQVAAQPEEVNWYEYIDINPVIDTLQQQLAERRISRVALLQKYTDKHRLVRDNAAEIAALERQIELESRDHPTIAGRRIRRSNPVRDEEVKFLLNLQSSLQEERARRVALQEQLDRSSRTLVQLKAKSLDYERLAQEVSNWRDTYELYIKREEEARVSEAMDKEKMVNVEVVQRPGLPLPRSDRRRSSGMLAVLAGLIVSLTGVFSVEYLNRTLKSEGDVERYLGVPLLATLSESARR